VHESTVNEDLLDRFLKTGEPVFRTYEPSETCAVLGAGGKPETDLLLENLAADGIAVHRRRGGGGTVVLAHGQVVLALVTEVDSPFHNREYARRINEWFIEALSRLGVERVSHRGISDLAIGEKKILGTSLYRRRLILFYQGSLLVSGDLSLFTRYLAMPTRVPDYRAGRGHEEFCTTLAKEGHALGARSVIAALEKVVRARLPSLR
jgi:lipoate-protein ligase A